MSEIESESSGRGSVLPNVYRKLCDVQELGELSVRYKSSGLLIVHCHGCFDIVHPGHLRYLQFARQQGNVLVVSLTGDDAIEKSDGTRPFVPQELRAENLAALEFVDHVVVSDDPTAETILEVLKPDIYIKGKEYENSTHSGFLAEKDLVESNGGRVIYSSGEVIFSSTEIVDTFSEKWINDAKTETSRLAATCRRWGIDLPTIEDFVTEKIRGKRVAVIGDAISDRYIFCDPINIASEAPVLSVRPLEQTSYLGGAAIIAAHLKAMGAYPHLMTTLGKDEASAELLTQLDQLGIDHTTFSIRQILPVKTRYLVESQKLIKIDQAEGRPLDTTTELKMADAFVDLKDHLDAVIFADFGYGTLTRHFIDRVLPDIRPAVDTICGDVSGARRTLHCYRNFDLITPTERELRSVMGDFEQSIPTMAANMMRELNVANLAVTMGARGCVMFRPCESEPSKWFTGRLRSDYLPSLARTPLDSIGAGDSFLAMATLILTAGGSLPLAGYLGSAAASIQVSRIGNQPIGTKDILEFAYGRPELRVEPVAD